MLKMKTIFSQRGFCTASACLAAEPLTRTSDVDSVTNVKAPFKRYRNETSVLRALASCVKPVMGAVDFRLGADPWLGSPFHLRRFLLARAKGRLAARLAAKEYFPDDIIGVSKEVPRVDHWLPLQSPDGIIEQVNSGSLPPLDGMDKLILLLAPEHAWRLYKDIAPDENWSDDILHRLLDLLCSTNGGAGDIYDLYNLPDRDEMFFSDEMKQHFKLQEKNRTTVQAVQSDAFEGEESSSRSNGSDMSDCDEEPLTSDVKPARLPRSNLWSEHNSAEQLFMKERSTFNTSAAYCSLVRGAAKYNNPKRALELADLAWSSEDGNNALDTLTYSTLIRSLHHMNPPFCSLEEAWQVVKSILDRFVAGRCPVTLLVFESILFTLAEVSSKISTIDVATAENGISIGLGLLNQLKTIGLEPNLGVMANLLNMIQSTNKCLLTVADVESLDRQLFSCSGLLHGFVSELTQRFELNTPSRIDYWTHDDFSFFVSAMKIALNERNLRLGEKLNRLLVGTEDRLFFLPTSLSRRSYIDSYCKLLLRNYAEDRHDPLGALQRVNDVYQEHRYVILNSQMLLRQFINYFAKYIQGSSNEISSQNIALSPEVQRLSYAGLSMLFKDILTHSRFVVTSNMSTNCAILVNLLAKYASINSTSAAALSDLALSRVKQQEEKLSNKQTDASYSTQKMHVDPLTVESFVNMLFPITICPDQKDVKTTSLLWENQLESAYTALTNWLIYAMEHNALSWKWAPAVISAVWHYGLSDEAPLWDAIKLLAPMECNMLTLDQLTHTRDTFGPLLDYLGHRQNTLLQDKFPDTAVLAKQRLGWINAIRDRLNAASVNDQNLDLIPNQLPSLHR